MRRRRLDHITDPVRRNIDARQDIHNFIDLGNHDPAAEGGCFHNRRRIFGIRPGVQIAVAVGCLRGDQRYPRRQIHEVAAEQFQISMNRADVELAGAEVFADLEAAILRGQEWATQQGVDEVMVIGGGQLYQQALTLAQRVYLTRIDLELEGDTFFPVLDAQQWRQTDAQAHPAQNQEPGYTFEVWQRV